MNNLKLAMIRNVLSSCLAVAVLAVMGVGQVQAQQFNTDDATVTATINVLERIEITAGNSGILDFGAALPGATDVSATPIDLTVAGADNAYFTISWTGPTNFDPSSGSSFGWTPELNDGSVSDGDELNLGTSGSVTLTLDGTISEVPTNVPSQTVDNSTITFDVTYTSL